MGGRLEGKVAVITGASGGIGAATAIRFAAEGARVALLARRTDEGQAIAEKARASNSGDALFVQTDATDEEQVDAAITQVTDRWGPAIHALFNNVGGAVSVKSFPDERVSQFERTLRLSLTTAFSVSRRCWPALIAANGATVVNNSSGAAVSAIPRESWAKSPIWPPVSYAAAKAVAEPLSRGTIGTVLRGDWLGDALHPLLTDFPVGCWLSAGLLDLVGGRGSRKASQRLIGFGLLMVPPTAAAGLSDWSRDQRPRVRRVGAVHAVGNVVASLLYLRSSIIGVPLQQIDTLIEKGLLNPVPTPDGPRFRQSEALAVRHLGG